MNLMFLQQKAMQATRASNCSITKILSFIFETQFMDSSVSKIMFAGILPKLFFLISHWFHFFFFMSYLSLCWLTIPANVNAAWQSPFPVVWVLFFATTPITSMLPQPVPPHHSQSKKTESSISIKEQLTAQLSPGKTPLSDLKLKW